jgi:hypothetical protein
MTVRMHRTYYKMFWCKQMDFYILATEKQIHYFMNLHIQVPLLQNKSAILNLLKRGLALYS